MSDFQICVLAMLMSIGIMQALILVMLRLVITRINQQEHRTRERIAAAAKAHF